MPAADETTTRLVRARELADDCPAGLASELAVTGSVAAGSPMRIPTSSCVYGPRRFHRLRTGWRGCAASAPARWWSMPSRSRTVRSGTTFRYHEFWG
jgi:hypothetical protein